MALDGLFYHKLLTELEPVLIGAKINKIHQPQATGITMKINSPQRGNCNLFLSAHPQNARLHLTEYPRENPQSPPLFCMVLRKHLENGRIISICQHGLDRVAEIEIEARNEIGDWERKTLIIEIMGKHSNLILLDQNKTILAGIKQYGSNVSRYRQVLPHTTYIAPQEQGKKNPFLLTEEELTSSLLENDITLSIDKALQKQVEGLSPLTAREIVKRSDLDGAVESMGVYDFHRLFSSLADFSAAESQPTITISDEGLEEFYFLPLESFGENTLTFPSLSLLLDAYFKRKETANAFISRKRELLKNLQIKRDKLANKVQKQAEELEDAENGDRYRVFGELLSAYLFQVPNGEKEVVLENFYDNNAPLTIPLDPALSPQANAQRYFRLYNKKKTARDAIIQHLNTNREELTYLESLIAHGEMTEGAEELEILKEECQEAGYVKEKKRKNKEKPGQLPPYRFTYQEYEISVGRNNKSNDRLTLKTAAKDDIWLHVKDMPGSHVIVHKKGKETVPDNVLQRAAQIAAWFSKGRQSANVPVDFTEVNQVKKPTGAKPGMVIYFNQTTLYVDPVKPEEETVKSQ